MAGEGLLAGALARFSGGMSDERDKQRELERRDRLDRQSAIQNALEMLQKKQAIGWQPVSDGTSDTDAIINENRAYGEARTPQQLEQMGPAPDLQVAKLPTEQGGFERGILNPDKTTAAQAAKRQLDQLTAKERMDTDRQKAVQAMRDASTLTRAQAQLAQTANLHRETLAQNMAIANLNNASREGVAAKNRAAHSSEIGFVQQGTNTDGSPRIIGVTRSGKAVDLAGGKTSTANTRAETAFKGKMADVGASERLLKNALDEVRANPGAFGLKNKLPNVIRQRLSGADVDAGTIGSLENIVGELRHGRFGGALSALEAEKAARIFSEPSSPADVIVAQLTEIGKAIKMRRDALSEAYGQGGSDQSNTKQSNPYLKK